MKEVPAANAGTFPCAVCAYLCDVVELLSE